MIGAMSVATTRRAVVAALAACLGAACAAPPTAMKPMLTKDAVIEFLHRFEALAEQENFDLIEDMVHADAVFRFNDGDFVGRAAIRAAFEKTWRSGGNAKKERFYLTDIQVLHTDAASASATYTYHWEGSLDGKAFRIQGRGTRVLVVAGAEGVDGGRVQILHEHLSRFPKP
jgi:Domain of unknown function (DUF4440)